MVPWHPNLPEFRKGLIRVLLNFQSDAGELGAGWTYHFLGADARTSIVGHRRLRETSQLREMVLRTNPIGRTLLDFDADLATKSSGSVWLDLTPEQYAKLTEHQLLVRW